MEKIRTDCEWRTRKKLPFFQVVPSCLLTSPLSIRSPTDTRTIFNFSYFTRFRVVFCTKYVVHLCFSAAEQLSFHLVTGFSKSRIKTPTEQIMWHMHVISELHTSRSRLKFSVHGLHANIFNLSAIEPAIFCRPELWWNWAGETRTIKTKRSGKWQNIYGKSMKN